MEGTESVWSIVRSLHRVAGLQRRAASAAPLGPVPLGVLNMASQSAVRPREAAAELGVPAQSITRAVDELVAAGLVRRTGVPGDGRSYAIETTDAGLRAREEFREQVTRQFARHLEGWSRQEVRTFAGQLERLVAALASDASDVSAPGKRAAGSGGHWSRK